LKQKSAIFLKIFTNILMEDAELYFKLGWEHIISWNALDHIIFILALVSIYIIGDWKKVLILITAFTIGHTITLGLSVYDVIKLKSQWVEFLIPCTIIITAVSNLFITDFNVKSLRLNYFAALFFGLIHGLGFANSIRFMLAGNQEIIIPLAGFNIGLEAGQIVIVIIILLFSYLLISLLRVNRKLWVVTLSVIAFTVALKLAAERWPL
jgi:hypothetical protein